MKYTVFFDQVDRTNLQIEADSVLKAREKATKLYKKRLSIPSSHVQEGWIVESDGEDK